MARIKFDNVTIEYPIYNARSLSLRNHLVEFGTGGIMKKVQSNIVTVKAIDSLTLDIKDGDRIGLTGHNGAGKSTLLKALAGLLPPTAGSIEIQGKVSTVFQLGAGLDPDLNGYENIIRMSMLLGISKKEAEEKSPEIAEFTELGDFLEAPVYTYSAGMTTRLMFAVSTSVEPEILLIDEMLGAGDASFLKKAQQRIESFIDKAKIFALASHSEKMIDMYCNKVFHLEHGNVTVVK